MTLDNAISEFRTIIELDSSGLPGLLDEEIRIFLNNGQLKLINQRLQGHTVDKTKYPETQKRVDDLNNLFNIETTATTPVESATSNFYDFNLDSLTNYMHLNEVTFIIANIGRYKMKEIPYHLTSRFEYSLNNKPYIENPGYVILNDGTNQIIRTYFDLYRANENSWVISLEVGYFKTPSDFTDASFNGTTTLSDFNIDVYREIIKLAVDEAIAVLSPRKVQVSQQQINKSE